MQLYQLTGRRGMAILYLYAFLGFGALSAVTPDFGALAKKVRRSLPQCAEHVVLRGGRPGLRQPITACCWAMRATHQARSRGDDHCFAMAEAGRQGCTDNTSLMQGAARGVYAGTGMKGACQTV